MLHYCPSMTIGYICVLILIMQYTRCVQFDMYMHAYAYVALSPPLLAVICCW